MCLSLQAVLQYWTIELCPGGSCLCEAVVDAARKVRRREGLLVLDPQGTAVGLDLVGIVLSKLGEAGVAEHAWLGRLVADAATELAPKDYLHKRTLTSPHRGGTGGSTLVFSRRRKTTNGWADKAPEGRLQKCQSLDRSVQKSELLTGTDRRVAGGLIPWQVPQLPPPISKRSSHTFESRTELRMTVGGC
jgi:hypothetical protein